MLERWGKARGEEDKSFSEASDGNDKSGRGGGSEGECDK